MTLHFRELDIEIPNLTELSDEYKTDEIERLMNLGKYEWKVQLKNYEFHMGSLAEWEWREIYRKLSGLDLVAKDRLIRLEVLVKAIISLRDFTTNKVWEFRNPHQKVYLRNILLSADKVIIDELYEGYLYGERIALEKFKKDLKDISERVTSDFFGQSGGLQDI